MKESDRTSSSKPTSGASDQAPTLQPLSESDVPALSCGDVLAGRYQIIEMLGAGGMGAVYKAFDRQLTRIVAVKTVLPEMAATPAALRRFKQEVLLAQSVVHKNIVRIFDIGEDGATKFITMDLIEGVDLKTLIRERGKLPAAEALAIIRQACQGLEAAHAAGVVHRDLKPQNIMLEKDGRVLVMDFGIAHSGQSRGVTQTGALLGTPEYMSPEQAKAEDVDERSDIFSIGLILYELLTGKLPFHGKTMLETMFKRTTERAVPPAEIDHDVPQGVSDIVMRCLETDRAGRRQSVTELLADLDEFDSSKKAPAAARAASKSRVGARYRNAAGAAAIAVVAVAAGFMLRGPTAPAPDVERPPETVLIADFSNRTGDPVFDGTLEPVVKLALEDAGFITAYDRTQLRSLGLPPVSGGFDEAAARQIAVGQGLGVVVSGSLDRRGAGYALSIRATEAVTGNVIGSAEETVSDKVQALVATAQLAARVRKALGDATSESAIRFAMETLTATSLEAVHEYAVAMDALSYGKIEEARSSFSKAVEVDPDFGLAYAGMAIASRNLGDQASAQRYIELALSRVDRMTERERYRTRGAYYIILGNPEKCVEEYTSLIRRFPSDAAAHNNLALCLTQLRQIAPAIEHVRQAAAILPKRFLYRYNISAYLSYAGDFQAAEREAQSLPELNSSLPMAFALLGQGRVAEAAETYRKLAGLSRVGASDANSGLADIALYEGRFGDAANLLEQGIAEDVAAGYSDKAAEKLVALSYTRLLQGREPDAIAAAENALQSGRTVKIRFLAGRILAAAGASARAQELASGLDAELGAESQAYARLIEGQIALNAGDLRAAVKAFTAANHLIDTWIGRFLLGAAFLEAGAFTEADSEFDLCIQRRGEALALFLDESPTYSYFPHVYYYLGRVREGLKSAGFAESYRAYLSIRGQTDQDPLLVEVRKKAAP
jgi:tetratricopeptide (TPR) repeat protein